MSVIHSVLLLALFVYEGARPGDTTIHIPTSSAVDYVRLIGEDQGYDASNHDDYSVDSLDEHGKPLFRGYTTMGFYVNGRTLFNVSINHDTGQAIDFTTCKVFDFPNLKSFQEQIVGSTKASRLTPQGLAEQVSCRAPKVLTIPSRPVPLERIR